MSRGAPGHTCPSADAVRQRAIAVGPAVLPGRRPDADLRPDADREFRPRRALHAGRLRRLLARQLVGQLLAPPCRPPPPPPPFRPPALIFPPPPPPPPPPPSPPA